jgi:hypothetical protein
MSKTPEVERYVRALRNRYELTFVNLQTMIRGLPGPDAAWPLTPKANALLLLQGIEADIAQGNAFAAATAAFQLGATMMQLYPTETLKALQREAGKKSGATRAAKRDAKAELVRRTAEQARAKMKPGATQKELRDAVEKILATEPATPKEWRTKTGVVIPLRTFQAYMKGMPAQGTVRCARK